jgi:cytochrome c oxidase subunit II
MALRLASGGQDVLDPHSHPARDISSLFWWMTIGAWIGLALVTALLGLAWIRRGRAGTGPHPGDKAGWAVVVGLGFVLPLAVVTALFVVSDAFVMRTTAAPDPAKTAMTVEVIGHQWYWEVRYPGTRAVTANEIHIPARTRVNLVATTADVIHSFWVPELNRKIDMIPGERNAILLYADRPGVYRGQCAEFCGLQHANMSMLVFADTPARFRAWLTRQEKPASPPTGATAQRGESVFLHGACASCHTIRGTTANADVGPDLTHVANRTTLAAVTIANTHAGLREWVSDPQHVKPGNQMPDLHLSGAQLSALVAYLEGLR